MAKTIKPILHNQQGFTLLEVLMAFTLFAVFITAFTLSQGTNLSTSGRMTEDLKLYTLCERVMNEAILNPPVFTAATKNDIKEGEFTEEGFKQYKYKIQFLPMELPNLKDLLFDDNEEQKKNNNQAAQSAIFEKLTKNMQDMLWQLKVTVWNTDNKTSYELTTWVTNENAKPDYNFTM